MRVVSENDAETNGDGERAVEMTSVNRSDQFVRVESMSRPREIWRQAWEAGW